MRVAIACVEAKFAAELREILGKNGCEAPVISETGRAVERLRLERPSLLVIVKPFFEGALANFLHVVRADPALGRIPILCLHPAGSSRDCVGYLEAGADDVINRPFNAQIFLARVRTLLRRAVWAGDVQAEEEATVLRSEGLEVRLVSRRVLSGGAQVALTRLEFELLAFLMKDPERAFKRHEILEAIWSYPEDVQTRTLDKHVETLRRKLGRAGGAVQTVHGVGYRFKNASDSLGSRRAA